MENPFKIDPFAMVYEAYERLYSKEFTVNWYADDIEQEIDGRECNVFGFTDFPEEGEPEIYTKVMYHMSDGLHNRGTLTPLYNADGTLRVWEE